MPPAPLERLFQAGWGYHAHCLLGPLRECQDGSSSCTYDMYGTVWVLGMVGNPLCRRRLQNHSWTMSVPPHLGLTLFPQGTAFRALARDCRCYHRMRVDGTLRLRKSPRHGKFQLNVVSDLEACAANLDVGILPAPVPHVVNHDQSQASARGRGLQIYAGAGPLARRAATEDGPGRLSTNRLIACCDPSTSRA